MVDGSKTVNSHEHRVTTPLPSKASVKRGVADGAKHSEKTSAERPSKFRDITEDDDGYHPYCDGPERYLEHEEDPWR